MGYEFSPRTDSTTAQRDFSTRSARIAASERLSDLGVGLYMLLTPLFRKLRHHPKYRDLLKHLRVKFRHTNVPVRLQGQ
jgi:hypothetical protein